METKKNKQRETEVGEQFRNFGQRLRGMKTIKCMSTIKKIKNAGNIKSSLLGQRVG